MDSTQLFGVLLVVIAGLWMGSGAWPIKKMRAFKYEHFGFWSMGLSLVFTWAITLMFCPHAIEAYRSVDPMLLVRSNLFSMVWGVANVLSLMCMVRIGFSLTGGILTGLGVSIGVMTPMIFKGSGLFKNAPDITSQAGMIVLGGVAVMLIGVALASVAGFLRHGGQKEVATGKSSFALGFVMVVVAGILSAGISFSFVYSQGPIVEAMKARGAGEIPANFAVWAVGLAAGTLINVLYPAWLLTTRKTWSVMSDHPGEILLCVIMAVNTCVAVILMGRGMLMLGALGASVGFGVQQAMQMLGGQAVGFISGEWKGVAKRPLYLMLGAILILITAAGIMALGNSTTH